MTRLKRWVWLAVVMAVAPGAAAADDEAAARGNAVFDLRCKACHTVEPGGRAKVGPNLFGIFGQPAASNPDMRYSKALRESGAVWDAETLDRYLEDIDQVVPKSAKRFAGLPSPEDRAAVIAYLRTLQ